MILLQRGAAPTSPPERWAETVALELDGHDTVARARALAEGADVLVSAGPYAPGALAAMICGDRPWFADVPGDPLAELQALAIAEPDAPDLPARAAAGARVARLVLSRADAFSAISQAQRHALIGQLGLLGRLSHPDPQERVAVVPVAWRFPSPAQPARARGPGDPLVVALAGGFNSWFDEGAAIAGLSEALDRAPQLSMIALGGGISGHYSKGYARFQAWAASRPGRVTLSPWAPERALPALLAPAHVGLCLDRAGYEAELGSRTRLLFFSHQGLLALGTARAELAQHMAEIGGLRPIPPGEPPALARALVALVHQPSPRAEIDAAAAALAERYAPQRVSAPLLAWLEAPRRSPPATDAETALNAQIAALNAELAAVQQSPTWRALAAGHRLVRRLTRT